MTKNQNETCVKTYFGVNIYRNTEPGYRLRWTAGSFAADTLQGIRRLIRDSVKGGAK